MLMNLRGIFAAKKAPAITLVGLVLSAAGCGDGVSPDDSFGGYDSSVQAGNDAGVQPNGNGNGNGNGNSNGNGNGNGMLPQPGVDSGGVTPLLDAGPGNRTDSSVGIDATTPRTDGGPGTDGAVGSDLSPITAPLPAGKPYGAGWTWVDVPGSKCRDGSGAGYYYRRGKEPNLLIFMNGGGACSDPFFCGLNPVNVNQNLPTQSLIDATGNLLIGPDPVRQMPEEEGVFKRDPKNPVGNWNMIYMPYCTGDVFAGAKPDGEIPGVEGKQQFVGYKNVGLFLDSFGPSFGTAKKVMLSGSSAGGFATLFNYDRVQTFFDKYGAKVYGITDSGIPFLDKYLPVCLQKRWRDSWNLNENMPKDCTGCTDADGGGLADGVGAFLFHQKYKGKKVGGMISSVEDGVIRAFFGAGGDNCTADPGLNTIASAFGFGGYPQEQYRAGLKETLDFVGKENVSSFFIDDPLHNWEHMHLWRERFYQTLNGTTIADWLRNVLDEKVTHVGSTGI